MSHIFISYSHEDAGLMQQVRDRLLASGFEVWTDSNLVPGTPSWTDAIERALEEAGCLVAMLSPDAKQSVSVGRELDYASTYDLPIIPLLLRGDKRTSVPFELSTTQWIDFRADVEAGMGALVAAIQHHLGPESIPGAGLSTLGSDMKAQFDRALRDRKWNVAIGLGEQMLQTQPDDHSTRAMLANLYWRYGGSLQIEDGAFEDNPYKQTMAIGFFDKAISLDPAHGDYYFSRGMLHKRLGDTDSAIADLEHAAGFGHARAKAQLARLTR